MRTTFFKHSLILVFSFFCTISLVFGSLGSQWSWVRENDTNHSLTAKSGALTITSEPGDVSENSNSAKSAGSFNLPEEIINDNVLLLKLEKEGNTYTASYSLNGNNWEELGSDYILLKDIKAGLIVSDGVITQSMTSTYWFDSSTNKPDAPFDVSFDYFRITSRGII